ncbi:hypothetical protein IE53DRAFT_368971 [Violaceomyces palustris]|uniref:Uncharacterized protein n=1 Tax=Violaceomyces palustris TaxID=1673888 RepID=A0ACD0NX16_9BASI|nr:hypothetical protein IE53DRAFT_368971 [Violaceomyces palustris]
MQDFHAGDERLEMNEGEEEEEEEEEEEDEEDEDDDDDVADLHPSSIKIHRSFFPQHFLKSVTPSHMKPIGDLIPFVSQNS